MRIKLTTVVLAALLALPASADTSGLISALTSQLGVTEEQAKGGAGALLDFARNELSGDDFSSLASAVPGLSGLADQAPEGESKKSGGLLSSAVSQLGGTAMLADQFQSLGLDPSYVQNYLPVVLDWVESEGGPAAMELLKGAF